MDSGIYFTLSIEGVTAAQEDLLTHLLFEGGAGGVQEDLAFVQQEKNYQPKVIESEVKSLTVYFESPPSPQWIEELQQQFANCQFRVEEQQKVDWLKNWKEQWKPFELIKGVWIVPDGYRDSFSAESGHCLYIEPGMAFGTGTHATTQLASTLIQQITDSENIKSLLDVGTGSGILALLAKVFGVPEVFAYDNDPESLRVLQENLEKNNQSAVEWVESWSSTLANKVDLTVANIIDGVLLDLKREFQKVNSPFYIFTGILAEREKDFLAEMTGNWSLQVIQRLEKEEWVGFLMRQN